MLPIISGTIYSAGKMTELDNKWKQKKESGKIFQKEMTAEEKQMQRFQEDLAKMRESDQLASITTKLKSGQSLSPEEIQYLKRNNPQIYREYQELQEEKKAYERELENCKTKEDVEKVRLNKMGSILAEAKSISNNPNIPKGQKKALLEKLVMKTMGIQGVHMDFVKSSRYASLPTEEEVKEEAQEKAEQTEETAKELGAEETDAAEDTDPAEDVDEETDETPGLSEMKEKADDTYREIRSVVRDYLMKDRLGGYGLEYLTEDLERSGIDHENRRIQK